MGLWISEFYMKDMNQEKVDKELVKPLLGCLSKVKKELEGGKEVVSLEVGDWYTDKPEIFDYVCQIYDLITSSEVYAGAVETFKKNGCLVAIHCDFTKKKIYLNISLKKHKPLMN